MTNRPSTNASAVRSGSPRYPRARVGPRSQPDFERSVAFQAASALVFEGREQPSGYTEPLLHRFRLAFKRPSGQRASEAAGSA